MHFKHIHAKSAPTHIYEHIITTHLNPHTCLHCKYKPLHNTDTYWHIESPLVCLFPAGAAEWRSCGQVGGCRSPTSLSSCLSSFSKWMLLSLKMCCLETAESLPLRFSNRNSHRVLATVHSWNRSWNTNHYASFFRFLFYIHLHPLPSPHRHHFFQRVFGHPSSPSSSHHLLHPGGEGIIGVEHERVPLSLATTTGAGPQVPAQGVPGCALLHDPLQHLSDPAGHIYTGLRRAPVPQQLYVSSTETQLYYMQCTLLYSLHLHFDSTLMYGSMFGNGMLPININSMFWLGLWDRI